MPRPPHVKDFAVVLDFGGQTMQLIARRCRELNVYSEILPHTIRAADLRALKPSGIILSGGPASVYEPNAPTLDPEILTLGIPILGICYGMQLTSAMLGGKVDKAGEREFGRALVEVDRNEDLFYGLDRSLPVWMSHGDRVHSLSAHFDVLGHTDNCPYAAVKSKSGDIYGIQFHPEVTHTVHGKEILRNFLYRICGCTGDWRMESFIDMEIDRLRQQVGKGRVILGLSGGVDSSVAAALIHKAIGDQLTCVFIDNGLLRAGEYETVQAVFHDHFHVNLVAVDASRQFLSALHGVTDPETKRKIIGKTFIDVFDAEAKKLGKIDFLAQGTIYPDVIESASPLKGPSHTIKSHHNVGGLPEKMGFRLVEPFRELFKDEVRRIGDVLELPAKIIHRHPFPGPGLAIRIIGEITAERLAALRQADTIILDEIEAAGWYGKLWQAFGVILPVSSVGVMGDCRTYEQTLAVRAVHSVDGMTADWAYLPEDLMRRLSNRLINEVKGINRVVYDISSKPPATIEWE